MLIEVWSDGSGNTFDSDGGYGYLILKDGEVIAEGSGYIPSSTNNVAELTGAIEGLKYVEANLQHLLPCEVELVADSQLVLGYANGSYKCKALHLASLCVELRKLHKALNLKTRWIKGHSGNEHNEKCDQLAKAARNGKGLTGLCQPAVSGGTDPDRDGDESV